MSPGDRDRAILGLKAQVLATTRSLLRRIPVQVSCQEFDDFVSAAWIGAIKAVDSFDPARSDLRTYATHRIRGEILDHMRRNDFLSRRHRLMIKNGGSAPQNFSLDHTDDESGKRSDIEDRGSLQTQSEIDARLTVQKILSQACLSARYTRVIFEYYWKARHMKEIGDDMGVNESRISQIHKAALEKARTASDCKPKPD